MNHEYEEKERLYLEYIAEWRERIVNSDKALCEQKPVLEFLSIINRELKAVGSGVGERFAPYWIIDDEVTDDEVTDDEISFVVKNDDDEGLEESWSNGKWAKILHPEHWDRVKAELKLFIKYPKSYMRTGFLINGLGGLIIFADKYRDKRYIDGTKITVTVHYWDYTPWMEPFFKSGVKALDPGAITLARLLWQKLELRSCHHSPSMWQTPTTADYEVLYYPDYLYRKRDLRVRDRVKERKKSTVEDSKDFERFLTLDQRFNLDERLNLIEKFWKLIEVVYLLLHRIWGWGSHQDLEPEVARILFHTTHPSDAAVFVKDGSMRYTYVSPALTSFFNVSASHFLGRTDREVFSSAGDWGMVEPLEIRDLLFEKVLSFTWLTRQVEDNNSPKVVALMSLAYHSEDGCLTPFVVGSGDGPTRHIGVVPGLSVQMMDASQFGADAYKAKAMQDVLKLARTVAKHNSIILLTGESGVGKDHLARDIHAHSGREGAFFSINCAAIAPKLAESELFGHEKGAFTGAESQKKGLLELAEGGTLLLNEIGDLALHLQAKLLTFLDEKKITRVGGQEKISVNARLLVATNKDLQEEIARGTFRQDLFYRISVVGITVPPLRERREDIPMIVAEIIQELKKENKWEQDPLVSPQAMAALQQYDWPGNVRQLRNFLERALILEHGKKLDISSLGIPFDSNLHKDTTARPVGESDRADYSLQDLPRIARPHGDMRRRPIDPGQEVLEILHRQYIVESHWAIWQLAEAMKIDKSTLSKWLKKHGLSESSHSSENG